LIKHCGLKQYNHKSLVILKSEQKIKN
jgi:hypothetical protein